MHFKLNQDRRRHTPEQKRKVVNWREYDEGLRRRGSLTVWFSDEAAEAWKASTRTGRGGQPEYSALAILTALTLRAVFRLPFRQTEGLIGSVVGLLGLDLAVPDHSTLCRRAETLEDERRRAFIGRSRAARARATTPAAVRMAAPGPCTGDGAYDQDCVYADVAERHPEAEVIVPPRSTAVPNESAETAPSHSRSVCGAAVGGADRGRRDRHLRLIAEKGHMGWQKASGYNARARAEASIPRYKRVIGDGLQSRTDRRRATCSGAPASSYSRPT